VEIILLEKVRNLGTIGDNVNVARGYARNYLLPQRKAVLANATNIAEFAERRAELEKLAAELFAKAEKRAETIKQLQDITITALASEEGKLFGSIGTREIAEAITLAGVALEKSEVLLSTGALRAIGSHSVQVQVHSDVMVNVDITVVREK
jgi:large subunit ribosomal protein L9